MDPTPEVAVLARVNGVIPDGPAAGRPSLVTDVQRLRDDPGPVGHHQRPDRGRRASATWRSAPGMRLADLAEDEEGKRITFADTQARPVPVITSPEWSGSEHGGRRYTAFAINVERLKPWHTLTGRHALLPRPRLDERARREPADLPAAAEHAPHLRRPDLRRGQGGDGALPHPALEVVDPLRVPGQPVHAVAVARRAGDLDEPAGRRDRSGSRTTSGSRPTTATAWSWPGRSCRTGCPPGTVYMYHAKDRTVDVPRTETSGLRGGIHNSLTRLMIKPTPHRRRLRPAVASPSTTSGRRATSATRSP